MGEPISAFAARRAVRSPARAPSIPPEASISSGSLSNRPLQDEHAERPRKKYKSDNGTDDVKTKTPLKAVLLAQIPKAGTAENPDIASAPASCTTRDEQAHRDISGSLNGSDTDNSLQSSLPKTAIKALNLNRPLSHFPPNSRSVLYETEMNWSVSLGRKDTLAILGHYDLYIRRGAVSIAGAVLHSSSRLHRVYAPSTHSLPIIRPLHNPYGPEPQRVEIKILSCGSRIRLLKNLAPSFARLWNGKPKLEGKFLAPNLRGRSFINLQNAVDDIHQRPLRAFELPDGWQPTTAKIISTATGGKALRILLCGPKGSGKSTLCRYLMNALLTRATSPSQQAPKEAQVILLDIDPGQPEFSSPGEISLIDMRSCNLGVPFTHPTVPPVTGSKLLRSHHVGSISPRYDPKHYLNCVLDLVQCYQRISSLNRALPLLINCSGWIQSTGLDIIIKLLNCSNATDVIYTSTTGPEDVVHTLVTACSGGECVLHQVSSQPFQDLFYTASRLRTMQTLSYFHLAETEAANLRWDTLPLISQSPMVVPYVGSKQAVFAVMILGDDHNPDSLSFILDGSVVGLVLIEDESAVFPSEGMFADSAMDDRSEEANGYCIQGQVRQIGSPGAQDSLNSETSFASSGLLDITSPQGEKHNMLVKTPGHLKHPSILRSRNGIPYMPFSNHSTPPLSPKFSRSLGQALVRAVDHTNHAFHLLTPIPKSELQSLHQQKRKIVLVRGRLDLPTWAYKEDLECEASSRRRQLRLLGDFQDDSVVKEEEALESRAEKRPWVGIAGAKRKGSAKVRRVRRDIRYRGYTEASE